MEAMTEQVPKPTPVERAKALWRKPLTKWAAVGLVFFIGLGVGAAVATDEEAIAAEQEKAAAAIETADDAKAELARERDDASDAISERNQLERELTATQDALASCQVAFAAVVDAVTSIATLGDAGAAAQIRAVQSDAEKCWDR